MLAIIIIVLNFSLLPLPQDRTSAPDAQEIKVAKPSEKAELTEIAEKMFSIPSKNLHFTYHFSPADMAESGLIDRGIYFVYDEEGQSVGVLKIVPLGDPEDEQLFEDEYMALKQFSKKQIPHFHTIQLIGRSQGTVAGKKVLILAESTAPGVTLNQLIKDYTKATSRPAKEAALQAIEEGVKECAIAMAELHKASPKTKPNRYYEKKFGSPLPGPYGMIHGDTHPGNIFYDVNSHQITFIDFQMAPSTRLGGPVGYDVANFITTVEILGAYKQIPQSELKKLDELFYTTYREHGPDLSYEDLDFYKREIYQRYAKIPDEHLKGEDSHQAHFIAHYCRERLLSS